MPSQPIPSVLTVGKFKMVFTYKEFSKSKNDCCHNRNKKKSKEKRPGHQVSVDHGTITMYLKVSMGSYEMGKELVIHRTTWFLQVSRKCAVVYEIGERTKTVPNKPL